MCTIWAVSLTHAASDTVRPALLIGGRIGSAVHIVVVAPGTESVCWDACWVMAMSKAGGAVFSSSKIKAKQRECGNGYGVLYSRCPLVLSASSASFLAPAVATAAACLLYTSPSPRD